MIKILFLGDIFGKPGRNVIKEFLPKLILNNNIDLVIANAENSAGGVGINNKILDELFANEINFVTGGNHSLRYREIEERLMEDKRIIRPANYKNPCPGKGWGVIETYSGIKIAVINLIGRVFIEGDFNCPFKTADLILEKIVKENIKIILLDFHAEATSEKKALACYLDGKATAVFGTHTHVQTNDAQILPNGLAFVTDLGMCGPHDSVIGMKKETIIERFIQGTNKSFEVAKNGTKLQGALLTVDDKTGKSINIELINLKGRD